MSRSDNDNGRIALIIGAGPAGLTAAYELLARTDIKPVILEKSQVVGGISRTVRASGNLVDIGGHRFFSKSDEVLNWWFEHLALEEHAGLEISYQNRKHKLNDSKVGGADTRGRMLVRSRVSRILFANQLIDYPLSLSVQTLSKLGLVRTLRIGTSYLWARLFPIRNEQNLEQFLINRFGRFLYGCFFRDYTEKVWGRPCHEISAEWGRQRIKGISISKVLADATAKLLRRKQALGKKTETSLIERFLYPEFGPGHLWETVATKCRERGAEIRFGHVPVKLELQKDRRARVTVRDSATGAESVVEADFVFSSMAVDELLNIVSPAPPAEVLEVSRSLEFRHFISVAIALEGGLERISRRQVKDNWIYIQEPNFTVGRMQILNNWSPTLVARPEATTVICLEYFANEHEPVWKMTDRELADLAVSELKRLDLFTTVQVISTDVIRQEKSYPGYFGSYRNFSRIRDHLLTIPNLLPVGRNGMHRYNNMDHSMLSAMRAVDYVEGKCPQEAIWNVNTEEDYHEESVERSGVPLKGPARTAYDWNSTSDAYEHYPTVRHRARLTGGGVAKVVAGITGPGRLRLFDYGCGNGATVANILAAVPGGGARLEVHGFDPDAVAVKRAAARNPGGTFRSALPGQETFEIITCCEVVEHTPEWREVLAWCHAHLAPGGHLLLTTQSGKIHKCDAYAGHTQHFTLAELRRGLEEAGFTVERAREWGFPFYTLQKYLTDIAFGATRDNFLEGRMGLTKRLVFGLAGLVFRVHDLLPFGPQLLVVASKRRTTVVVGLPRSA